ncbi:MAG TPA: DUF1080 domain-containing protein [Lacunisphaera sp.]|nr:DUF1080 domain-containing protein [Lacunisphaera sp.]
MRRLNSWAIPSILFATILTAQTPGPTADPDAGFVPIFDGTSLAGWDGDPKYWRVEDGAIVGEITPETIVKRNTFIIWRGGEPADFELKLEYRISNKGNSGVNYRSVQLTDVPWSLAGYQADIDGEDREKIPYRWTGQNYEERGRTFLAKRGEIVRVDDSAKPTVIGSLGDAAALAAFIKPGDWNEYHLIARGGVITHILNGHVMSVVVDDDVKNRRTKGLIGVQVHVGPPMKVEFRHIRLKVL